MTAATDENADRLGALMARAQGGDRAAYEMLLRECSTILRRQLGRRFPGLSRQDAEDLVQDVLIALHGVRATYDPGRPFLPWLTAIARNRAIDLIRRRARRSAREVAVDTYPETLDEAQAKESGEGYGDPEALRRAMATLPKGQQVAIDLLKLKEMSLKEASQASGMSIAALKVATFRATRALRVALQGRDGDGH